jgi:hypothetical protein
MTARVKRLAVLVLTWIVVTASATAMAWWSVTFVTAEVADRRPLRPSDVVAASVRQAVPVPAWVYGAQPVAPPREREVSPVTVSPVTEVVVEAVAAVSKQAAVPPASAVAVRATALAVVLPVAVPAVAPAAVTLQVASLAPVTVKPSPPVQPDPSPRTGNVSDWPVAAASSGHGHRTETARTVAVMLGRTHETATDRSSPAAASAVAPKRQLRSSSRFSRWRNGPSAT